MDGPGSEKICCFIRNLYMLFYKKLSTKHSTKSFLKHEMLVQFSTKSFLIGFLFFECMICQCGH